MNFIFVFVLVLLVSRTGYLQIVKGEEFAEVATTQSLKELTLSPRRGNILDRNGIPLATTRPSFSASLVYTGTGLPDEIRDTLVEILGLSPEAVDEAAAQLRDFPFKPARLKSDLSQEELTSLYENMHFLPGVLVESQAIRYYPYGDLAAHVLGYIRQISKNQLEKWRDSGYDSQDVVGYEGLESLDAYDQYLQGTDGFQWMEVDSRGRRTRYLGRKDPVPGSDLVTTIDLRLQLVAEEALDHVLTSLQRGIDPVLRDPRTGLPVPFGKGGVPVPLQEGAFENARAGAVVVLDVKTGQVLALASRPAFDPNIFSLTAYLREGSTRRQEFDRYLLDILGNREGKPLLNRVVAQIYPPGSTYKPVTALAALEAGKEIGSVNCSGAYQAFGRTWKDWAVHGNQDLIGAIAKSCNVYFYQLGQRLGIDDNPTAAMARAFGLDGPTGLLGLPPGTEKFGRVPTADLLKQLYPAERALLGWFPGDTLNVAIGQGPQAYTPLQLAGYTAMLANGGQRLRPYLVQRVVAPHGEVLEETGPEVLGRLNVSPGNLARVRQGMLAVTLPGGTAYWRFADWQAYGFPVSVGAKTGTAEAPGEKGSHGLFVAFAPFEDPEIALAVVVEHGGGGSLAAAPVARAILDEYFGYDAFWEARQPESKAEGGGQTAPASPQGAAGETASW